MPLRFWKKEKPEKGKEEPEEKAKEAAKAKGAPPAEKAPTPTPEAKPAEPAAPAKPADLASVIGDVHGALVEFETWADDFAFLLVREPRWEKLAETELVVVKADQTSRGGECGECGAPVGKYW